MKNQMEQEQIGQVIQEKLGLGHILSCLLYTSNTVTYNKSQVDNNEVIITENSTVVVTFGDKEQRIEAVSYTHLDVSKRQQQQQVYW